VNWEGERLFKTPAKVGAKWFITLKVFDILGREVTTLVNEKLQTGTYEVDWNGSNYPSGIYFYRLLAGDFVDVKKMLLIIFFYFFSNPLLEGCW
jgi:hypothetical protein